LPDAGSVAGIKVGDGGDRVEAILGEGISDPTQPQTVAYLDNGVRIDKSHLKVQSIEIARKRELINKGTPAFVRPDRPRFYVCAPDTSDPTLRSAIRSEIEAVIGQIGPYQLAAKEDEADYMIHATQPPFEVTRTSGSEERKDKKKGTYTVYYTDVAATATLLISVTDADGEPIPGLSRRDYRGNAKERVYEGSSHSKDGGDAYYRRKAVTEAVWNLLEPLYKARPVQAQVTKVDYTSCKLWINLGRQDGIQPRSQFQRPTEFQILVDGEPLEQDSDRYTEATEEVKEGYAVVECSRKGGLFGRTKKDWDLVFKIPDPACAQVTALIVPRHREDKPK